MREPTWPRSRSTSAARSWSRRRLLASSISRRVMEARASARVAVDAWLCTGSNRRSFIVGCAGIGGKNGVRSMARRSASIDAPALRAKRARASSREHPGPTISCLPSRHGASHPLRERRLAADAGKQDGAPSGRGPAPSRPPQAHSCSILATIVLDSFGRGQDKNGGRLRSRPPFLSCPLPKLGRQNVNELPRAGMCTGSMPCSFSCACSADCAGGSPCTR